LASSDRGPALTIVEKLVHDNGTAKSKQPKFDSTDVKETRMGLIYDVEVVNFVLAGPELFQHLNIFASAPNCVDGNVQVVGSIKEIGEFGKRELFARKPFLYGRLSRRGGNLTLDTVCEERRILRDVTKSPGENVRSCELNGEDSNTSPRCGPEMCCHRSRNHQCG
jgi:hypothetical protein